MSSHDSLIVRLSKITESRKLCLSAKVRTSIMNKLSNYNSPGFEDAQKTLTKDCGSKLRLEF